nr:hypothetical protein Iba_chr10bCG8590 [Ipomoea batatas]
MVCDEEEENLAMVPAVEEDLLLAYKDLRSTTVQSSLVVLTGWCSCLLTRLVVFNFLMDVNSFVDESSDDESSPYDGEYDSFYDDDEDDTSSPSKNVAPTPNDRDPPSPDSTTRPKRKRHKAL